MPQRKDPSRKALSDAYFSRVQVGMVKNYFFVSGFVLCEECDYTVGVGDCLKHHKEVKHERFLSLNCFQLQFK